MPTSKTQNRKTKIPAARWAAMQLFAMDVDGILTDGTVLISSAVRSPGFPAAPPTRPRHGPAN
jgi:hypothetical protein